MEKTQNEFHSLKSHPFCFSSAMASGILGYERFQDGPQTAYRKAPRNSLFVRHTSKINGKQISDLSTKRTEKYARGNYFHGRELSKVFFEDYDLVEKIALDPRGPVVSRWNKIFLLACFISLFVDPLFFYLPVIKEDEACLDTSEPLEVALTVIRSMVDAFYIIHIFVRFRTAYVAPSSRLFGRGELVIDRSKIGSRYLRKNFWLDLIAAIPLPQVLIWVAIPRIKINVYLSSVVLLFLIIFQYLLRLYLIVPLSRQIVKFNGILVETAWAGATYNLMLYMLASHVVGSWWYRFSVHRLEEFWKQVCILQQPNCQNLFFSCRRVNEPGRVAWLKTSNISGLCSAESDFFQFGIYGDAVSFRIAALNFLNKYYYCLWWGLRNLSDGNHTSELHRLTASASNIAALWGKISPQALMLEK